ncbi:hypothetical protein DVA67_024200 [Solirubrobacter sp. CPCC 204708]|uniref:Lipoprotein n=1 Tax=Solirubrobacter deserti TaxID=2282478 RepID=A0ABT4RKU6_9ACTN|nr:hypothetical protein [Solirubrobacter deserti]MBE2319099.1 hypothetical protein [Solirubrobacter deserti]MDA0139178.1 hypothetical protein [Solirubrobacter deserti]
MTRRILLAAAVAVVAGCGAEKETPSEPAADQNRQAMLDYARCMRENGVDMPDPKFEGGRVTMAVGAPGQRIDPDKLRTAEQACAKYQEAIKPPEMSDEDKAEFKARALEHSRCMRENGIEDFPDPTFDENGGARMKMTRELDPESPAFQKAQQACEKTLPGPGGEG